MSRKYFFFDIDNTLTDRYRNIIPSARQALAELQQSGHFVAVATGRAHYKTVEFTDPLGLHDLVCNGGCCLVYHDEMFLDETLDTETARQVLRQADRDGIGWLLMLNDSDQVFMRDYLFLSTAGLKTEPSSYVLRTDLNYETEERIYKIYLAVPKGQEPDYPWLQLLPWQRYNPRYLFMEQEEKKKGILRMLKKAGGIPEEVVVFGDGKNDVSMFDPRWFNIAMGNGSPLLKEKADYVAPDNTDDGILKTCRQFHWI